MCWWKNQFHGWQSYVYVKFGKLFKHFRKWIDAFLTSFERFAMILLRGSLQHHCVLNAINWTLMHWRQKPIDQTKRLVNMIWCAVNFARNMKKEQKTVNLSFDNSRDIRNIEQFFLPVVIMKSNFFFQYPNNWS